MCDTIYKTDTVKVGRGKGNKILILTFQTKNNLLFRIIFGVVGFYGMT